MYISRRALHGPVIQLTLPPCATLAHSLHTVYWFIVSFEYVAAAIGLYAVLVDGKLASLRGSVLGLYVIATLLFIYTSSK